MNIFFSASIHGKKKFEQNYRKIVDLVKASGHNITADHILSNNPQQMKEWEEEKDFDFHRWVMQHIKEADAVFAELSYSSTSVGYLVSLALSAGKPVVIFYNGEEEPHLFKTLEEDNDRLVIVRYKDLAELEKEIPRIIQYAGESRDVRFNFFISPKHVNYLNWIAKTKKIPRSVFLRRLINREMRK